MDLKEKIKKLPSCPGVYLMKDSLNNIIYVGKSKNLKNRVSSYFQNSKSHSPKVIKLVQNLRDFEYIITDTEFEAFLLECKLIKEYKPPYNKQMKSPKSYSYIKITTQGENPNIEISTEFNNDDKSVYLGPYSSKNTVQKGLTGLKEHFKISCSNSSRKGSSCINYSLGICIGMCLNDISKNQCIKILNKIINLFDRNDKGIIIEMEHKMNSLSQEFDFEGAAKYRDYITSINYLIDTSKVVNFTKKNKTIALLEFLNNNSFKFFLIQGHKVLFKETYSLDYFNLDEIKDALKTNILLYFNKKNVINSIDIGKEEIDESQIIYNYLKNKSNDCKHIVIPKEWLDFSNHSAHINKLLNKLLTQ